MWSTRGYRSIIDYILTNKILSPLVNDTNVFRGYDVTTDHYLLISKIRLPKEWYKFTKRTLRQEEIFRVYLLEDPSIKLLYQRRLEKNLMHSPCSLNIDVEWQTLKNTLQQAANETLGKRKKRRHKRRLILWNEDIKNLIENKKKPYLRYLTTSSETDKLEYKRLVAIVQRETRKIKRQCWETFVSRIEYDLHGRQINAYKIIRNLNRTEKDNLRLNSIVERTWLDYYQNLWTKQFNDKITEGKCAKLTENCVDLITMEELETTIKALKTRKSPGSDGINNELYKHAPKFFLYKVWIFLNVCWIYGDILEEWRPVIVIPIQKRDRINPDDYRGISLLNTGYKIYSKIITKRLTTIAEVLLLEEENGFRKGRSCMDCISSASQIIEKHREFNIPTYIAFIGFKKPLTLWTETNYGLLC